MCILTENLHNTIEEFDKATIRTIRTSTKNFFGIILK